MLKNHKIQISQWAPLSGEAMSHPLPLKSTQNGWDQNFRVAGMVTRSVPSPHYEQLLLLPTPSFKMFLERFLDDLPPPHLKHLSLSLLPLPPRGYLHIRRSGGLAPKFASEIRVRAPNFASKNRSDKYPNFVL